MSSSNELFLTTQELFDKLGSRDNDSTAATTVSALDLYHVGRILTSLSSQDDDLLLAYNQLQRAYQQLIESLANCDSLFHDLCLGLEHVLQHQSTGHGDVADDDQATLEALTSLEQLASSSPKAARCMARCQIFSIVALELFRQAKHARNKPVVFKLMAYLLPCMTAEELLDTIQSLYDQEELLWITFLQDQLVEWKESLLPFLDEDGSQQDYLRPLLFPVVPTKQPLLAPLKPSQNKSSSGTTPSISPHDEIQRRIDLVTQVLPDLGQGFVEMVLSYYKGNVEQTVAALLENNLPPALSHLDCHLPRLRPAQRVETAIDAEPQDEEALAKTKAIIEAANQQAERESMALEVMMDADGDDNMYNDDYDDQWDNDHDYDAPNVGLYDNDAADNSRQQQRNNVNSSAVSATAMDYQSVLLYNKAMKQVEAEQQFWQENANTNLRAGAKEFRNPTNSNTDNAETSETLDSTDGDRKFRGPDKLRGGRIPNAGRSGRGRGRGGPARGGGAAASTTSTSTNAASAAAEGSKPMNTRRKENQLAKRKDKQRQAMAKRSGA